VAADSKIEWTQVTWNPVTGCSKVSQGCAHCYAERMARRLQAMGVARYRNAFRVTVHEDLVQLPRRWKSPRLIFVNSMSDLFHEDVSVKFIQRVFATMTSCRQHTFQVLTKRSRRLHDLAPLLGWSPNIWMGVSVENSTAIERISDLKTVPAAVRFLSCEPLLGPLDDLPLAGIHWVIVGGESGPHARPMRAEWVDAIRRQCSDARVPFFFKQWGGTRKNLTGRQIGGRTYDEMPYIAQPPASLLAGMVHCSGGTIPGR
jgi:protein gp37